ANADRAACHQGFVLLLVQLALQEVGLRLREVALRLVEVRLILARVELVEELTGLHGRPVAVGLGEEVALDLGADLRVDVAVGGPDPFRADGNVSLDHLGDPDVRRRWRGRLRLAAARNAEPTGERETSDQHPVAAATGSKRPSSRAPSRHASNLAARLARAKSSTCLVFSHSRPRRGGASAGALS